MCPTSTARWSPVDFIMSDWWVVLQSISEVMTAARVGVEKFLAIRVHIQSFCLRMNEGTWAISAEPNCYTELY